MENIIIGPLTKNTTTITPEKKDEDTKSITSNKTTTTVTGNCSICYEAYNKSNHKQITCYCGMKLCNTCIKTYILSKHTIPHCFECKIEWTREFLMINTNINWVKKEYTEHLKKLLFSNEESQFMTTVDYIERTKERNRKYLIIKDKIKEIEKEMNKYRVILNKLEQNKSSLFSEQRRLFRDDNEPENVRREFVCKCPTDNCNGFLSSQHKCNLCNNSFCSECSELKNTTDEHICNEDLVKSVQLMKKECKNCPKCTSPIYKIDGCDMMWCVSCHTAFSWQSLKILNANNIHNPHYFQWLASQRNANGDGQIPRNPNDILCGREINHHFITPFFNKYLEAANISQYKKNMIDITLATNSHANVNIYNALKPNVKKSFDIYFIFTNILNSIQHIRYNEIERFTVNYNANDARDLRVEYLQNQINQEEFKANLVKRNKKTEKNNEIRTLLLMYINCATEVFYRILDVFNTEKLVNIETLHKQIEENLEEFYNLVEYVNQQFERISYTYSCVKYKINNSKPEKPWYIISTQ
jgi:hypothetical protein